MTQVTSPNAEQHNAKHIETLHAYPNQIIDCKVLESKGIDSIRSTIYFMGVELTGGTESTKPYNQCFFGTLDSKDSNLGLDTLKPIYHLQASDELIESTSNNRDSSNAESNNSLSTLQVFLNGNTLTLLNYSLLDSSLNIKLECNSSESKEIVEREKEQAQRDSSPMAQNDNKSESTAMLHPILEDNEIKCPHNGIVKLKANKGKPFTSKGISLVLESDLLNSPIIGCTNPILSGGPCTSVAVILPSARGLKKFNDDYPIMQNLVASGCLTDKGFPLICTPKENTFRINSPNPANANTQSKESLSTQVTLHKPSIRLYYKEHRGQIDNIPLCRCSINDTLQDSDTPFRLFELDIHKDSKELQDTDLKSKLQCSYPKDYEFKEIDITIGIHSIALILIIPQTIPKVFKEVYKNYEYKDYGIGRFQYVYEYCDTIVREKRAIVYKTLYTPAKIKKIELEIANGLDSMIEEREGVLKMLLINK